MTRRFSPDLGSSWPFLSLYSVPPQHLLKEATIGGTLAMFCVVERVSGVSYFCSSRRLGSSRRMSWWWELCQRKLSGQTCALPLCGPAGHGQGKTPSGTTLRNGVRSRTPCIEHSLPWNNFPLFEELQSDTSVPPKSSASVLLTLLFMDQVLASRIQLREAWRCQEQNTTPKACSPFADDWKQHLQDLLKSSIKLCSSVSCRPA